MDTEQSNQLAGRLPPAKAELLNRLVDQLRAVAGIAAVVLGGSYAAGRERPGSDLDIGLYYHESAPFAIADIRQIARSLDGSATVTDFYGWGAWVNGGAWIQTPAGKVDFLYRNLDQVQRTIDDAHAGIGHHDYDQQPTHGFYSVIYLAETQICLPLYDPSGYIAALKAQVAIYPPRLKQRIIADSLWAAEFALLFARDYAAQGDVYNTAGCLSRIAANLTQALFALNETYFIRDKQVMATIAAFPILPAGYTQQIEQILAAPGDSAASLARTVEQMAHCWRGVAGLEGVVYAPKFHVA